MPGGGSFSIGEFPFSWQSVAEGISSVLKRGVLANLAVASFGQ
jgi:hypothetical protein